MKKIEMLRDRFAAGKQLLTGQIITDEIHDIDKSILVRMGSAKYIEPEKIEAAPGADPDGGLDISNTVAEIKAELDLRGVSYDPKTKKADLLDLLNGK